MSFILFLLILIVICALFVILSRNPVQSILFLMLGYFFSAIIFLWAGAEFMAFTVLMVYVGAISILFLFVIMMLDLRIVELYSTFFNYLPIGGFIGIFFFFLTNYIFLNDFSMYNLYIESNFATDFIDHLVPKSNLSLFGEILYNYFNFIVILMSLILLVAMLGSIVLTIDFNEIFIKNCETFYKQTSFKFSKITFWTIKERGRGMS